MLKKLTIVLVLLLGLASCDGNNKLQQQQGGIISVKLPESKLIGNDYYVEYLPSVDVVCIRLVGSRWEGISCWELEKAPEKVRELVTSSRN